MTPLTKPLKRALRILDRDYVLTLSERELKLTLKGRQKGLILDWAGLVSGESALAVALRASVGRFSDVSEVPAARREPKKPSRRAAKKPSRRKRERPNARQR
jgi:hypothetical protein